MAKKIVKIIKLQIVAGKATPAPPIGPALGGAGINIMAFCKEFNAKTQAVAGTLLPTVITVYADKSFTFITKETPMAKLLMAELGIAKGSAIPNRDKVGKLSRARALEIAKKKIKDMNSASLEAAVECVFGTARSMGIDIDHSKE